MTRVVLCMCALLAACDGPVRYQPPPGFPLAPPTAVPSVMTAPPPPPPEVAQLAPLRFPSTSSRVLANGTRVTVASHPESLWTIRMVITGAGGLADRPGVAQLAAELVRLEVVHAVADHGAIVRAWIDAGHAHFELTMATDPTAAAGALARVLGRALPATRFRPARTRAVHLAFAHGRGHDRWIARELFTRTLLGGGSPTSRRATSATASEISRLRAAHCTAFFDSHYVPRSATAYVVGPASTQELSRAADALGSWTRTKKSTAITSTPAVRGRSLFAVEPSPALPSVVTVAWLLPPTSWIERLALRELWARQKGTDVELIELPLHAVLVVRRVSADPVAALRQLEKRPIAASVTSTLRAAHARAIDTNRGIVDWLVVAGNGGLPLLAKFERSIEGLTAAKLDKLVQGAQLRAVLAIATDAELEKLGKVRVIHPLRGFAVIRSVGTSN